MKLWIHFGLFALVLPIYSVAAKPDASQVLADLAAQATGCKTEVAKFEETIGFIRQHQGNAAAAAIKEKLLPAKTESDLLASEGYCGLANYIRTKKLNR